MVREVNEIVGRAEEAVCWVLGEWTEYLMRRLEMWSEEWRGESEEWNCESGEWRGRSEECRCA